MWISIEMFSGDYLREKIIRFCSLSCSYKNNSNNANSSQYLLNTYDAFTLSKDCVDIISINTKNDINTFQFIEAETEA